MTRFDALWDESPMFRGLFIGKGRPFSDKDKFDKERAVALWDDRHPKVDWDTCRYRDCTNLVQKDQCCSQHCHVSGEMPLWAWVNKILYRYISFQRGAQKTINDREYRSYVEHAATRKFKRIPNGYRVFLKDRNVFNYRPENLVLLSKYSFHLVQQGLLTLDIAIEIDMRIGSLLHEKVKAGRRPFFAMFGYGDIHKVSGVQMPFIRKEVERRNLDPSDLASIVEFVNKHKNSDNVGMNGEG